MSNVKKYMKRIIILVTVFMLFMGNISNASLTPKQQQALIGYTRTFVLEGQKLGRTHNSRKNGASYPSVFGYCVGADSGYNEPMKLDDCPANYSNESNTYNSCILFCCASFVGGMYYKALGIDVKSMVSGYRGAGAYMAKGRGSVFLDPVEPDEALEPGDALASNAHAVLYMGYNEEKGIHEIAQTSGGNTGLNITSIGGYKGTSPELRAGEISAFLNRQSWCGASNWQASRLKDGLVDLTRDLDNLTITWPNGTTISAQTGEFLQLPGFTYYGIPLEGEFSGIVTIDFTWLIAKLVEIADWIVGLMIYSIKVCVIGWIAVAENLLTNAIEATVGEVTQNNGTLIDMMIHSSRNITIENIVFNRVPIFDINFFNYKLDDTVDGTGRPKDENTLTGQTSNVNQTVGTSPSGGSGSSQGTGSAQSESVIIVIKKNIARWYYSFRMIAIVLLLLILLYIVIRMIISTIAAEKATYKRMLLDWIVSFIIVFGIHYYMATVISLNEIFVALVEPDPSSYTTLADGTLQDGTHYETTLYEAVRTRAYEIKASRAIAGVIMYGTLVYYAIRYSLIYVKRYLTIMILAIISPFIGLTYSFSKLKDSKKPARIVSNWLTEFTINVFLQTIHAVVYATLIMTALKMSEGSIAGIVLCFIILNFLVDANKILRKIVFKKPTSKKASIDNTEQASVETYMGIATGVKNSEVGKKVIGGAKRLRDGGLTIVGGVTAAGISAFAAAGAAALNELNSGNARGNGTTGNAGTGNGNGTSNGAAGNTTNGGVIPNRQTGLNGAQNPGGANSRLNSAINGANSRAAVGTRPVFSNVDNLINQIRNGLHFRNRNRVMEMINTTFGTVDWNDPKMMAFFPLLVANPVLGAIHYLSSSKGGNVKHIFNGVGKSFLAIPMLVISPKMGVNLVLDGISSFRKIKTYSRAGGRRYTANRNSRRNRNRIRRAYRMMREQGLRRTVGHAAGRTIRGAGNLAGRAVRFTATGGVIGAVGGTLYRDLRNAYNERQEDIDHSTEMVELLLEAREAESDIIEEIRQEYMEYIGNDVNGMDAERNEGLTGGIGDRLTGGSTAEDDDRRAAQQRDRRFSSYIGRRLEEASKPEIAPEETRRIVSNITPRYVSRTNTTKIEEIVEEVAETIEEERRETLASRYILDEEVVAELHRMYGEEATDTTTRTGYTFEQVVVAKQNVFNMRERAGEEQDEPSPEIEVERIRVDREEFTSEVIEELEERQETESRTTYTPEEIVQSIQETIVRSDEIRRGRVNNNVIEDRMQRLNSINERAKALAKDEPTLDIARPVNAQDENSPREIINVNDLIRKLKDVSKYRNFE